MLQGRGEETPSTAASPLVEASCNKSFHLQQAIRDLEPFVRKELLTSARCSFQAMRIRSSLAFLCQRKP
jgi:hypothetical protein